MEEKMLEYALRLVRGEDVLGVFKELEKLLEENGLYQELINCKEKIWHIDGDDSRLKEMGILYRENLKNLNMAYLINLLYLKRIQPELYNEIICCLKGNGFNSLDPGLDENSDKFSELWKIADRYCGLSYIIAYLNSRKAFDTIYKIIPYFEDIKNIINEYMNTHEGSDENDIADIYDCDKQMSIILSNNSDNIELNKLAVKFDKENETPYINILDKLIEDNDENKALDFYNTEYCKNFDKYKVPSFINVIWEISHIYYRKGDFYKSLYFQQKGISYELKRSEESKIGETV